MDQITITLPMTERELWVILSAIGLAAMTWLVWLTLSQQGRKSPPGPLSWLIAFGWVLLPLWLVIFCATLWQIWSMLTGAGSILTGPGGLGAGALIAALLSAPFVIWGTVLKQRAVVLSETALFNDKINAALEGLYSRRQITRAIKVGGEEKILTEWQDDIVQRNGAIDRLEGLARERPSEAPRIANILSVYVRELSKESEPQTHPRQIWMGLVDHGADKEESLAKLGLRPDDITVDAMKKWATRLQPFRTDAEKAAQTLGRLQDIQGVDCHALTIDLRGANMQGFDLKGLRFTDGDFEGARMEGVNLVSSLIKKTNLSGARMEGANITGAWMQAAYLWRARLDGADLGGAQMMQANASRAQLRGANLAIAQLEGTYLNNAQMQGVDMNLTRFDAATNWSATELQNAYFRNCDFWNTSISADQVYSAFGDGSNLPPDGFSHPVHWPDWELPEDGPHAFDTEYRKWLSNPANYTPPPKPNKPD